MTSGFEGIKCFWLRMMAREGFHSLKKMKRPFLQVEGMAWEKHRGQEGSKILSFCEVACRESKWYNYKAKV